MKGLLGQSAASALIRASGTVLSLLLSIVMTRMLSTAGYGLYAYVLSFVALVSIPVKFGLPLHVTRETARAMADDDTARVWALWIWAHRLVLTTGTLALAGLALWLFQTSRTDPESWQVWIWGGLLVPVLAFAHLRSAAIRGLGYSLFSQVPEMVLRPLFIIVLVLGFTTVLGNELSPVEAVMLNVFGTALVFILGIAFMVWRAPPRPRRERTPPDPNRNKVWFFSALTLGLTVGAQTLGGNMDVFMLGLLRDNAEVGLYKVALNGGSLVGFGLQSINMILLPRVARMYQQGAHNEMQALVIDASRLALIFTALAFAILFPFGRWLIVTMFGADYADAYITLMIISGGQLLGAMFGSVMLVVNMTGNEKAALFGTVGFALINIALNAALIPLAGKEGAAIATAASLVILNIYLWSVVRKRAHINTLAFGKRNAPTKGNDS